MKRIVLPAMLMLFIATAVQAQAPTGLAVGYEQMIRAGQDDVPDQVLPGISLRYFPAGGLGAEAMVGLRIDSPSESNRGTGYNLNLGANVLWGMYSTSRVRLNGFAGGQLFLFKPAFNNADTETDVALLIGLEPEVFVWDSLSLSTRMGLRISFNGDVVNPNTGQSEPDSGGTIFGTFGPQFNLLEGINIRYYF